MKFSRDSLLSGLRKRAGSSQAAEEVELKRPCLRRSDQSIPSPAALPTATLVEEGEREENPPDGVPIGTPSRGRSLAAASSPAKDVGEPPVSEEVVETPAPGPLPPRGAAFAPLDDAGGPSRSPQAVSQSVPYVSCLSETVLRLAVLPKFQARLKNQSMAEAFDTVFTAALHVSNGLLVIQEDLANAKFLNESLGKELEGAKARELKALNDLQAIQEDSQAWRKRAELELRSLDATLTEVRARLLPTEEKLRETALKLEHAESRADSAEAAARDAAEKLILAEKDVKEASDKAAALKAKAREKITANETKTRERIAAIEAKAQGKVAAAEARACEAVQEYKSSPEFALEVREGALDAYVQGFDRCKERLSQHFKLENLERFQAEDEEETPDTEVRAAADGAATARDLTTGAPTAEGLACSSIPKDDCPGGQ